MRRLVGVIKKYKKKGRYGLKAENVSFSKMQYKKFFGEGFLRKWTTWEWQWEWEHQFYQRAFI